MVIINKLSKSYCVKNKNRKNVKKQVLKDVSITFNENDGYCLVGESGSGKSTLGKLIMGIEKPTFGEIIYNNKNICNMNKKELKGMRREIQIVFQDSFSSLDPRMTIYESIAEPIRNFENLNLGEEKEKIETIIDKVQLQKKILNKLPNQLSGGQQKRVCIARAIAVNPKFIIFDEAVSGLDVTVKKKILDLILKLRKDAKSTYLFITHDINVAFYMSNNIVVMKEGRIIEYAEKIKSMYDLNHSYSKRLINSLPLNYPKKKEII